MLKVFITGSSDGLGLLTAQSLIANGHQVFAHARNETRKQEVAPKLAGAAAILVADLSNKEEIHQLANELTQLAPFDVIIHNAGIYYGPVDSLFTVNVLAPYILTVKVPTPKKLIYLSSNMHLGGKFIPTTKINYADSKLLLTVLVMGFSKAYPNSYVNAVDPGWVPTKMGGVSAPDDLQKGFETQLWLASSNTTDALVTGGYFHHQQQEQPNKEVYNPEKQQTLFKLCAELSDTPFN